ncbi:MAG: hypothetical protein ABT940_14090, partial [Alphaproteobacteria bacterium]
EDPGMSKKRWLSLITGTIFLGATGLGYALVPFWENVKQGEEWTRALATLKGELATGSWYFNDAEYRRATTEFSVRMQLIAVQDRIGTKDRIQSGKEIIDMMTDTIRLRDVYSNRECQQMRCQDNTCYNYLRWGAVFTGRKIDEDSLCQGVIKEIISKHGLNYGSDPYGNWLYEAEAIPQMSQRLASAINYRLGVERVFQEESVFVSWFRSKFPGSPP